MTAIPLEHATSLPILNIVCFATFRVEGLPRKSIISSKSTGEARSPPCAFHGRAYTELGGQGRVDLESYMLNFRSVSCPADKNSWLHATCLRTTWCFKFKDHHHFISFCFFNENFEHAVV